MSEKEPPPSTVDDYSSGRDNDSNGPEQRPLIDWSEAEERALVRKLDLLIMPLLIAGFFVLQLDRGNIGNGPH
ncbi:hypothetical protein ACKAV7_005480 [Fusarium commune]